jgi:hypothetical protein
LRKLTTVKTKTTTRTRTATAITITKTTTSKTLFKQENEQEKIHETRLNLKLEECGIRRKKKNQVVNEVRVQRNNKSTMTPDKD